LSQDGVALLSNDPHLALRNPAYWYLAHLDSKTAGQGNLKVAGMSFPGLPGIVIGRNEHIAWGMTTTYFDASDVYVETLSDDGTGVMFNGDVVPFLVRSFRFEYADGPGEDVPFRYVPHHGPVIAYDAEAGFALSLRWTGHDVDTDANYLMNLAVATNVAEAKAALRNLTAIGQNVVVADVHGDIGWFPYNRLPQRPWASEYPPWLPLPGTGEAEWGPWIDYDDLPQLENPAAGYIATANNDMTGASFDGDPTNDGVDALQIFIGTGYRHGRIVQRLEAEDEHDRASMESIVADNYSLFAADILPAVFAAVDAEALDDAGRVVLAALEAWQFRCPTGLDGTSPTESMPVSDANIAGESIGCTAFHVMVGRLLVGTFEDEMLAAEVDHAPGDSVLVRLLNRPDTMVHGAAFWDDVSTEDVEEGMGQIVATAFNAAGAWLGETLGADPDTWRWGRLHTMTVAAPLFNDAGVTDFNFGPFANDGGIDTVDVGNCRSPERHRYHHTSGASVRFTCEMTEPPACSLQLPGGQRHRRAGEHYNDLLPRWLANDPFEMPFTAREVTNATVSTVEIVPSP
jgi:penicillin amidase